MANSDCANNAEIGQFDLIVHQTIHGTVVAPQVMSVEKKVPKCIAVTSTCNEAATDAIWTWSHLGCKSHVEHVLDTENSKFCWQGTVFNFTLEVRGDSWRWSLLTIAPHPLMGGSRENEQGNTNFSFKYFFYNYNFYYLMFFCCYYYFCYSVIHPLVLNLIDTGMEATRWETWLKNAAAPNKKKQRAWCNDKTDQLKDKQRNRKLRLKKRKEGQRTTWGGKESEEIEEVDKRRGGFWEGGDGW